MSLRDLLFEKPDKPVLKPATTVPIPVPVASAIARARVPSGTGTAIYQRLKDKTLFENTTPGQVLNKYLTPLLALPIEERAKYKAAMAQAQAQESITIGSVLGAIDSLKDTLAEEQKVFDASIEETKNSGILEKLKQQEDLKRQISTLTAQCSRLDGEINVAQAKITQAQQDFQTAFAARTAELEEQKARYTDLLK